MSEERLRIAIDCRTVTAPKTGDRTYALNLTRSLARVDRQHDYLLYTATETRLTQFDAPNFEPVVLPADPAWWWTPFTFPRDLARSDVSVAHVQYIIPPHTPCPIITTVHDVAFRKFPRLFPAKHSVLLNTLIPIAVHRAARVIVGSENTKRDLIQYYRVPEQKIAVTPYAADAIYQPMDRADARQAVRDRFGIARPYVLSVGVLQPRKNLPRLVRAFAEIRHEVPHVLVLVGKQGWAHWDLQQAIKETRIADRIVFTNYVADADLPVLYAGADLFVYPSIYEGFGLPPLEAMACGTAVLTSNSSSLPEVVGDAGRMVDPLDMEALAREMEALLLDRAERERLAAAGLERSKRFSWDETARQTVQVYEAVAAERNRSALGP